MRASAALMRRDSLVFIGAAMLVRAISNTCMGIMKPRLAASATGPILPYVMRHGQGAMVKADTVGRGKCNQCCMPCAYSPAFDKP